MNLQDIIRRVQRLYGDSAEAQVYVTDIIDWVNDAQFMLNRDLELLLTSASLDVDATTAVSGWALPVDYVKSVVVKFKQVALVYTPYNEVKAFTGVIPASDPSWYYIWSNKLMLYPTAISRGTGLVYHEYVRSPLILKSSTDIPELPAAYHLDLVRYCLLRAKELNEDEQAVNRINSEWVAAVAESKFQSNPHENSYPVVRDYAGDLW
jgi:hypothetical protein